jgi:hypothetical protein
MEHEPVTSTYHLRPSDLTPTAICGAQVAPELTANAVDEIPSGGRVCMHCIRKLHRVPIGRPTPPHLARFDKPR